MISLHLAVLAISGFFLAGFVRGLTGFGGPLLLIPVLILVVDPPTAAFIVILVDLLSNVAILAAAVRDASYRVVGITVVSSCLAIPFGSAVMVHLDPMVVRAIIFVTVGLASVMLLSGFRFRRPLKGWELAASGAAAGGVMGVTALGIAIIPVLLSSRESMARIRANIIVWVFFASLVLLAQLLWNGRATIQEAGIAVLLAPIYAIGALWGKRQFPRINEVVFRRWVLAFLLVVSVIGFVSLLL